MIFTPFGTALDTENYGKLQGTFFGKSFSDIAQNGLFGKSDEFNSQIEAINSAFEKYKSGIDVSRDSTKFFHECIADTSAEFKNYVKNLDLASISVENLEGIMNGFQATQGLVAKGLTLVRNSVDVEALRELAAQIKRHCERLMARASFDRTSVGQVTAVGKDGTYTVAAFGGSYVLPYKEKLTVGAVVRVKVPQNNWKEIYIESVA